MQMIYCLLLPRSRWCAKTHSGLRLHPCTSMEDWEAAEDAGLLEFPDVAAAKKSPPPAQDWQDKDDEYEPKPALHMLLQPVSTCVATPAKIWC